MAQVGTNFRIIPGQNRQPPRQPNTNGLPPRQPNTGTGPRPQPQRTTTRPQAPPAVGPDAQCAFCQNVKCQQALAGTAKVFIGNSVPLCCKFCNTPFNFSKAQTYKPLAAPTGTDPTDASVWRSAQTRQKRHKSPGAQSERTTLAQLTSLGFTPDRVEELAKEALERKKQETASKPATTDAAITHELSQSTSTVVHLARVCREAKADVSHKKAELKQMALAFKTKQQKIQKATETLTKASADWKEASAKAAEAEKKATTAFSATPTTVTMPDTKLDASETLESLETKMAQMADFLKEMRKMHKLLKDTKDNEAAAKQKEKDDMEQARTNSLVAPSASSTSAGTGVPPPTTGGVAMHDRSTVKRSLTDPTPAEAVATPKAKAKATTTRTKKPWTDVKSGDNGSDDEDDSLKSIDLQVAELLDDDNQSQKSEASHHSQGQSSNVSSAARSQAQFGGPRDPNKRDKSPRRAT